MAVDIVMPQMGESIFEGTITKWLKKPGDKVERDEPLFEISTDKVDAEIPSPSAGVLKEIKVGEGKTVPIQTVVGVIEAGDSSCSRPRCEAANRAAAPGCKTRRSGTRRSCFRARSCVVAAGRRTHPQLAAGPPHGQGTWHRSRFGARHRGGWPHQQTRH